MHVLRCNNTSLLGEAGIYQVLTEKYCYRVRASGQPLVVTQQSRCQPWNNSNRALFLDVLSKKTNGTSGNGNGGGAHFTSQHSDSANYYLVIQV